MSNRPIDLLGTTIDRVSAVPLHRQLSIALRNLINDNACLEGQRFPNELDLARHFRVSRGTVRSAIGKLVEDGMLERRAGVGTRVVKRPIQTKARAWPSFSREMASRGLVIHELLTMPDRVAVPANAAQAFGIEAGQRVWRLCRLRGVTPRNKPHAKPKRAVWFRSWFPPELISLPRVDLGGGLYQGLEAAYGLRPERSQESLSARAASVGLARRLGIKPGQPVLVRSRVVRDQAGQVIEFAVNHYRSDLFEYAVDLEVKAASPPEHKL